MSSWRRQFSAVVSVVLVLVLLLIVGCDDFFGSDDDNDALGNPVGSWITVLPESSPGPLGEDFRAALLDIDESHVTCIFYDETTAGVVQVSGFIAPYVPSGSQFAFEMTHAWLGEDPGDVIVWAGKDWYQIPDDVPHPPDPDAFTVNGDTLTVLGPGLVFDRITFGLPDGLIGAWESNGNPLELSDMSDRPNFGGFEYEWGTQEGSGYWQASGPTSGFLRQIYTVISDDPDLKYWEHLNPYVLDDATLHIYMDLDLDVGDRLEYTRVP